MEKKIKNNENATVQLPVLALRGLVLFPHMVLHFDVGREQSLHSLNMAMNGDRKVFLVAQVDQNEENPSMDGLYKVGTVAEVRQIVRSQGESLRVLVEGCYRGKLIDLFEEDHTSVGEIQPYPAAARIAGRPFSDALIRTVKDLFDEYIGLAPRMPKEIVDNILDSDDPLLIAEYIAGNIPFDVADKQRILEQNSTRRRLEIIAQLLEAENEILALEADIQDRVKEAMDKNQRDYYLREQLRVINEELGDGDADFEEPDEFREKIRALLTTDENKEKLLKEVSHMEKMPPNSQEAAVIRGYLETCLELPWGCYTRDVIDLKKAAKLLDKEHYGLKKIKERVLEALAVRALAPDINGQILCFVGPPGVGKTSIVRSIAQTMGRRYARIALGGIKDESEIRGHRKTYVGSMPGRIINAIKQAGSANPVLLLDEVDKLSNDYRGDPSSALLEVLDAEQNCTFRDHYIEMPFDLSHVFFIATANDRGAIPPALLDRMEVIELPSYTREEKFQIAKRHLLPKQRERHGLTAEQIGVADSAIYDIIDHYTREAGVRTLERRLAALCRKVAAKVVAGDADGKITIKAADLPDYLGPRYIIEDIVPKEDCVGLVNGLAWTAVGGELLQVETAVVPGTGKTITTGSLGDVMKESVSAAITYIRSVADQYEIENTFYKDKDIHIHFPEGAVPKDGPSAGITTCTALISALGNIPVRHDIAMTGEITLRGRVLAIGGLREKSMAAYKNGIKTVIIPAANEPDLAEIDDVVKKAIRFVPVHTMQEVLEEALVQMPGNAKKRSYHAAAAEHKDVSSAVLCR